MAVERNGAAERINLSPVMAKHPDRAMHLMDVLVNPSELKSAIATTKLVAGALLKLPSLPSVIFMGCNWGMTEDIRQENKRRREQQARLRTEENQARSRALRSDLGASKNRKIPGAGTSRGDNPYNDPRW